MMLSIAIITGLETLPMLLIPLAIIALNAKWNPRLKRVIIAFTIASIIEAAALYIIYH